MAVLTVLIPVRNAADSLGEALASIAAQTLTDWDAIVVDDGSTDESPQLLRTWAALDPRFRVETCRGRGIVDALNQALASVTAPFIARMDADDIARPHRFARQMERMSERDVALVGCRTRYFPEERVQDGARRYESWLNSLTTSEEHERDLYVECPIAHPTFVARTDVIREIGGYQARGWPEDYDLLLRLSHAGHRMAKVPETLLLWRESDTRTSRVAPEYALERFPHCRAHYLLRRELAGGREALIFGAGPVGKAFGRALVAAGGRIAAYVDIDPKKIGQSVLGGPVLSQVEGLALRGGPFGLGALGQPGQRQALREALRAAGWVDGVDFTCVA